MILTFQEFITAVYNKGLKKMLSDIPKRGRLGYFGTTAMFTFFMGDRFTITLSRKGGNDTENKRIIFNALLEGKETIFLVETVSVSSEEVQQMLQEVILLWPSAPQRNLMQKRHTLFPPSENMEICWANRK